jgi:hypothetical protein
LDEIEKQKRELLSQQNHLIEKRGVWPKLLVMPIGRGAWDERVGEVFARECGWTAETNPLGDEMKYLLANVKLYLEVHKDGTIVPLGLDSPTFKGSLGFIFERLPTADERRRCALPLSRP